jgi:glucose/arabinose dehydrogenase
VHPETGAIWEHEHGPLGGDEINVLVAGANYGWPLVSFGLDYDGTQITETGLTSREGLESPLVYWVPSIAPSGLSFYAGEPFALWQGNALVGSLMRGRVRGSGHFQRLSFENGRAITREPILL